MSANGIPKDSTTWLNQRAGGADPKGEDDDRRNHGDGSAQEKRNAKVDEPGHHDLAGISADAGGGYPRTSKAARRKLAPRCRPPCSRCQREPAG